MKKLGEAFVVRKFPADYAVVECLIEMILKHFCLVDRDEELSYYLRSSLDYIRAVYPSSECDEWCDDFFVSYGRNYIEG